MKGEQTEWPMPVIHAGKQRLVSALLPVAVAALTAVGVNLLGLSAACAAEVGALLRWFA